MASFSFTRSKKKPYAQPAVQGKGLVTMPIDFSWPMSPEQAEFARDHPFDLSEFFLLSCIFINLQEHRCTGHFQLAPPCALVIKNEHPCMKSLTLSFHKKSNSLMLFFHKKYKCSTSSQALIIICKMWKLHNPKGNFMNENCCEHFGMSVAEKFGCKVKGARRTHAKYVDLEALISIHGVSILTAVRISPSRKSDLVTEICQISHKLTTPFDFCSCFLAWIFQKVLPRSTHVLSASVSCTTLR